VIPVPELQSTAKKTRGLEGNVKWKDIVPEVPVATKEP
jgi:hypothetical protein